MIQGSIPQAFKDDLTCGVIQQPGWSTRPQAYPLGYAEDIQKRERCWESFSETPEAAQNFRQQGRRERDDRGVPLRYVAGRHATENVAGGNFQQPITGRGWRLEER